jgi:hypothetical protein
VRIKASGKDCIGTSLESLPAKILTLEPRLQLVNVSVNFIYIS